MATTNVPNLALLSFPLPALEADWDEIQNFALTFDGYEHWGSSEACAEVANARKSQTLSDLRTCLFYEQRRWRHFGEAPDANAMDYIRSVLKQIRERIYQANHILK